MNYTSDMQCPDIRVVLAHFLRQIESRHARTPTQGPTLLHWSSAIQSLEEFPWPLDSETGERVTPSNWEAYRRTHKFKAPSCLCAYLNKEPYTESRVGLVEMTSVHSTETQSILNGEYVAVCAEQRCGFLLCIERLYIGNGLKVKFYPKRSNPLPPQQLAHVSDIDMSLRKSRDSGLFQVLSSAVVRGMGRTYLPTMTPREARKPKEALLQQLSRGISEASFWNVFVQCLVCKDVVFRDTMATNHMCHHRNVSTHRGRHHPYSRSPALRPHLTMLPADVPEVAVLRSLRTRSPVPTEIDTGSCAGDEPEVDADETESESEGDRNSSPPPPLSSDFELPTLLEIMGTRI